MGENDRVKGEQKYLEKTRGEEEKKNLVVAGRSFV